MENIKTLKINIKKTETATSEITNDKQIWCCDWGLIKPEQNEQSTEDNESSTGSTVKQRPKEFVVTGGSEPHLKIVHISPIEKHVFPYEYDLPLPGMGVHTLAVSPDSSTIAAVSMDGNLMLVDVKTGVRLPQVSHSLVSNFWSTAFGANNSDSVFAGTGNGQIFKYDTTMGKLQHSYNTEHSENILGLAISDDERLLGATDYAGRFTLIDAATGQPLRRRNFKNTMRKLVFHPGMQFALAACDDSTIKVIDLPSCKLRESLKGHDCCVTSVAASPDGQRFVSGDCNGTIKVWDSRTTKNALSFFCDCNQNLRDVAFSRQSNKISFVGDGKGLNIYYCLGTREFMLI